MRHAGALPLLALAVLACFAVMQMDWSRATTTTTTFSRAGSRLRAEAITAATGAQPPASVDRRRVYQAAALGVDTSRPPSFLAVGDWGSGDQNQRIVAAALERTSAKTKPAFVLSLGDQVYPSGVASPQDPLFRQRFGSVYSRRLRSESPWFMMLGNHDCEGSIEAQIAHGRSGLKSHSGAKGFYDGGSGGGSEDDGWRLPQRYYGVEFGSGGGGGGGGGGDGSASSPPKLFLMVLDSCSLVCGQGVVVGGDSKRPRNPRCGGALARFSATAEERAHRDRQLAWVDRTLARYDPADWWLVVSSHWPIFSRTGNGPTPELIGDLLPVLRRHGVHAYLNGHDHSLQHLSEEGQAWPQFFVSGGGGYGLHHKLKRAAKAKEARAEVAKARLAAGLLVSVGDVGHGSSGSGSSGGIGGGGNARSNRDRVVAVGGGSSGHAGLGAILEHYLAVKHGFMRVTVEQKQITVDAIAVVADGLREGGGSGEDGGKEKVVYSTTLRRYM